MAQTNQLVVTYEDGIHEPLILGSSWKTMYSYENFLALSQNVRNTLIHKKKEVCNKVIKQFTTYPKCKLEPSKIKIQKLSDVKKTAEQWEEKSSKQNVVDVTQVVKHDSIESKPPVSPDNMKVIMSELSETVNKLVGIINQIPSDEDLESAIHHEDRKIMDILHKIELDAFNAADGYIYAKMIKDCRKKRRAVKDMVRIKNELSCISNESFINQSKSMLKAIKDLDDRKYKPRELKGLFED